MNGNNDVNPQQVEQQTADDELLDYEGLRVRLKKKTVHAVKHLVRNKGIPFIPLSGKDIKFYWPDVLAHLRKCRTVQPVAPTGRKGRKLASSVT